METTLEGQNNRAVVVAVGFTADGVFVVVATVVVVFVFGSLH